MWDGPSGHRKIEAGPPPKLNKQDVDCLYLWQSWDEMYYKASGYSHPSSAEAMKRTGANTRFASDPRLRVLDFEKPPVVETSLGFYFTPLSKWNIINYGLLWQKFMSKYPSAEFKAPIGEMELSFAPNSDFTNLSLRAFFVDTSKTQLVQIQNGCFLRNWRKTPETPRYQHYDEVLPIFREDWLSFAAAMREISPGELEIKRCEMTYFNHLVRGEDWTDFSDFEAYYSMWRGAAGLDTLSKLKMTAIATTYEIPHGTLQINSQPGIRQMDGKEVVQLTVTAQIIPTKQKNEEFFQCLDRCHEANVNGFLEFTTEEFQQKWKRKR